MSSAYGLAEIARHVITTHLEACGLGLNGIVAGSVALTVAGPAARTWQASSTRPYHRVAAAYADDGPLQQPPTASAALAFAVSLLSAPPRAGAVHISKGVAPAQGVEPQAEMESKI